MTFQTLVNGFIAGGLLAVLGTGFWLVHSSCRYFPFSLGAALPIACYGAYVVHAHAGVSQWCAFAMGASLSSGLQVALQQLLFGSMQRRSVSSLAQSVASLGMYTSLVGLLALLFGYEPLMLRGKHVRQGLSLLDARATAPQLTMILAGLVVIALVWGAMRWGRWGKRVLALAESVTLAETCGINIARERLWVSALAGLIVGVGGLLLGLESDVTPNMGAGVFMMSALAAVTMQRRGLLSVGVLCYALGTLRALFAWFVGSQWQDFVVFSCLLVYLLIPKRDGRPGTCLDPWR